MLSISISISHMNFNTLTTAPRSKKFKTINRFYGEVFSVNVFSVSAKNGNWANWGRWSSCSKSCGGGSMTRSRTCSNPAPKNGGRNCAGFKTQSTACNKSPCPGKERLFAFEKRNPNFVLVSLCLSCRKAKFEVFLMSGLPFGRPYCFF